MFTTTTLTEIATAINYVNGILDQYFYKLNLHLNQD